MAYRHQLPAASKIHPVIHVSQLKKALPPATVVSPDNDLNYIHIAHNVVPLQVTETKLQLLGDKLVPFDRVQWNSLPSSWTTWENLRSIELPATKVCIVFFE